MARRVDPTFDLEHELWADGCDTVVGIDEVGKGAWAGPLVIGAVVVPRGKMIAGVRDSKAMTPRARDDAYDRIIEWASVLAKVSRDRQMVAWAQSYPYWSFEGNKGYPCPAHIRALHGHGPSAIHRRSWAFMDNHVHWSGSRRVVRGQMPTLF